jgi:peptidoglycan/LPS O-acetylase OafA/YrhL
MRSLSIAVVLANHALLGFFFGPGLVRPEGAILGVSASTVISIEWLFVLSGFLIGAMMIRSFEKEGRTWWESARDFWLRRWFRTIPNYYLFLLVNALLVWLGIAQGHISLSYFVFSQNLVGEERVPHFFGEAWSLALDEWFYFILPLLIGLLGLWGCKQKKTAFFLASAALIAAPTLARWMHDVPADFLQWDGQIRRVTIYHLDATGWGVLAAAVNKWCPHWWRRDTVAKAAAGVALMLCGIAAVQGLAFPQALGEYERRYCSVFATTLMNIGTFLSMPWITQRVARGRWVQWLTGKLSDYSYSIYLAHFPGIYLFTHALDIHAGRTPAFMATVVIAWLTVTVGASALIFHSFEKPVADLRERFTKRVNAAPF